MAMMDWNGNGKDDPFDHYMDYKACKNSSTNKRKGSSSGNMSTFGAILCTIGGMLLTGMLFSEADMDDVPGILLVIIWTVLSIVIAVVVDAIRR